jgi:hypothetical protein
VAVPEADRSQTAAEHLKKKETNGQTEVSPFSLSLSFFLLSFLTLALFLSSLLNFLFLFSSLLISSFSLNSFSTTASLSRFILSLSSHTPYLSLQGTGNPPTRQQLQQHRRYRPAGTYQEPRQRTKAFYEWASQL